MKFNETVLDSLIEKKHYKKEDIKSANFNYYSISSISISQTYEIIQYLSLRGNYIKSLHFLKYFPSLFYFDINNNPIEDYSLFNKYNTFGFLSFSPPEKYLEKKILVIKKLTVGILHLQIEDESNLNGFIANNPNIVVFNNTVMGFEEKLNLIAEKKNTSHQPSSNNLVKIDEEKKQCDTNPNETSKKTFYFVNNQILDLKQEDNRHINIHLYSQENLSNKIKKKIENNKEDIISKKNNSFIEEQFRINFNVSHVINHKFKILIDFITSYNNKMINLYLNDNNNYHEQTILNQNEIYKIELDRLSFISELYHSILSLEIKDNHFFHTKPICIKNTNDNSPLTKKLLKSITYPYLQIDLFKVPMIPKQVVILSSLLLYILGILPKEMCKILLLTFYAKYKCKKTSVIEISNNINILLNLDMFYLIAVYYNLYKHLTHIFKEKSSMIKDNDIKKYYTFLNSLRMLRLIGNLSKIEQYRKDSDLVFTTVDKIFNKNDFIVEHFVDGLRNMDIFNDTITIIHFINDLITYEKYEDVLVKQKENSHNFQIFLEIKEIMFNSISKGEKAKSESIADKIFNDLQIRTLLNKIYFKNENSVILTTLLKSNVLYSFRESSSNQTKSLNKSNNDIKDSQRHLYQTERKMVRSDSIIGVKSSTTSDFFYKVSKSHKKIQSSQSTIDVIGKNRTLEGKSSKFPTIINKANNSKNFILSEKKNKRSIHLLKSSSAKNIEGRKGETINVNISKFKLSTNSNNSNSSGNNNNDTTFRRSQRTGSVKFNINKISFDSKPFKTGKFYKDFASINTKLLNCIKS